MAKKVDFFDGAQSSTVPTVGNTEATALVAYADDASYEAANAGSPVEGNIYFNTTIDLVRYYNGTSWQSVLDEDGTQTLQNKTIDGTSATGNNTVLTDADDVSYDNTSSGLVATHTQGAIDEVEGRLDIAETDISNAELDISNLETLSGSSGATDHGTFTGTTIPDSSTTKSALQSLETAVEDKISSSEKGAANGVATLDGTGKVPSAQLPSFVDDVLEYADLASFPVTGETGKIYVALDTNKTYRWTGSIYVEISASEVTTVNGQTGTVSLGIDDMDDYTASGIGSRHEIRRNSANTGWENYDPESITDDITTGANATLVAVTTSVVRLTSASLESVDMIPAGESGQKFILVNDTGVVVLVNNETGATPANQVLTGTGGPLELDINATISLVYDGTDSRWRVVGGTGAGGSGILGIVTGNNSTANSTLGDWVTYADAAQTTPEDGTGGSPNITLTQTTNVSEILNGRGSFKVAKGAFDRQGEGTSLTLDVPKYLRGQSCELTFSYDASANFDYGSAFDPVASPSDVAVYLYDVTNSLLITPATSGLHGGGRYRSQVTVPLNCESLRVVLHVQTASALAWDFFYDNVELSLAKTSFASSMTDWIAYTPVFSGFGTVTSPEFYYRRDGDTLEVQGRFTSGTPAASQAQIGLPTGLVIDSNKLSSSGTQYVGSGFRGNAGSNSSKEWSVLATGGETFLKLAFLHYAGAQNPSVALNGNGVILNGEIGYVNARIPILGWSAGASLPEQIMLDSPATMVAFKNGGAFGANVAIPSWTTVSKDTVGGFNATTGVYTVVVPGDYMVGGKLASTTGTGDNSVDVYVNGTIFAQGLDGEAGHGSVNVMVPNLTYGDTIDLRCPSARTAAPSDSDTFLSIVKLNSSTQPYAPQTVYVKQVQPNGTDAGTFTSGAWVTRFINTIEGNYGWLSLVSNQITLQPGRYEIDAAAAAYFCGHNRLRWYDVTNASTVLLGLTSYTSNGLSDTPIVNTAVIGSFTVTAPTVFELQHRCTKTQATNGLGGASGIGVDEVYVQIKFTKVA